LYHFMLLTPVAAPSKAWVYCHLLPGIAGSKEAWMSVSCILCVVR